MKIYFTDLQPLLSSIDELINEVHNVQPAKGFTSVLVPREPEQIKEKENEENSVYVEKSIYDYLKYVT